MAKLTELPTEIVNTIIFIFLLNERIFHVYLQYFNKIIIYDSP